VLIQFRVENHRSLRDEQILSLAATSDKVGEHVLRVEGLGEALVPVVAIYGANASGKSNVLSALDFLRQAIVDSQRRWEVEGTPQDPFQLSRKASEPSLYEVELVVDGVRYRYGFQLSASRIEEEWLFAWPHGRMAAWPCGSSARATISSSESPCTARTKRSGSSHGPTVCSCQRPRRTTMQPCFRSSAMFRAGSSCWGGVTGCIAANRRRVTSLQGSRIRGLRQRAREDLEAKREYCSQLFVHGPT